MRKDTAAYHRRRARQLELTVVTIVLVAVVLVFAAPSLASYNHVDACKRSLRGYSSDDDIHAWGVRTLAKRFVGWSDAWHGGDGSAYVVGVFEYSYGWVRWTGHCWGGDYHGDGFS